MNNYTRKRGYSNKHGKRIGVKTFTCDECLEIINDKISKRIIPESHFLISNYILSRLDEDCNKGRIEHLIDCFERNDSHTSMRFIGHIVDPKHKADGTWTNSDASLHKFMFWLETNNWWRRGCESEWYVDYVQGTYKEWGS